MICFGGKWITEDNNIMRYVGTDENGICLDTIVDFKGFVSKICYCLKVNQNQSNVYIFIPSEASMGKRLYKI